MGSPAGSPISSKAQPLEPRDASAGGPHAARASAVKVGGFRFHGDFTTVGFADPETRTTTGLVSGLRFGSLGLIIIGTQLGGNADYLGPAIVFSLVDLILVLLLSVEIGHHAGSDPSEDEPDSHQRPPTSALISDDPAPALAP